MFDALARFADGKARRIGIAAVLFFLVAAAIGGSVANRLDPYGADDPATETVKAKEQLEGAGLRVPAVFAVVEGAPIAKASSRARVEALERSVRRRADVKSVSGYYDTRSPVFVSRDHRSSYFAVTLKPTEDKRWQEAGAAITEQLSAHPGVIVGGAAVAQEQVNKQVEEDLRMAELLGLPAALPALAALLPQPRRLGAAADDRRPGDRRHLPDPPHRQRIRLDLDLRPQPDHGAGAGTGDRLQPLHRLPLPRGDRQGRAGAGGDAPRPRHLRAHRLLLLADGRRGARLAARLPAALPLLDGPRRGAGGAVRGADLAHRPAGGPDHARHPGQRRCARVPAAPGRGRYEGRRERLLVPPLALRDAPAAAGGNAQRPALDRHGPALLRDQVRHRRPFRAAEVGERAPGLRHDQQPLPALPRDADLDRRRRRRPESGDGNGGAACAGSPALPKSLPPSACAAASPRSRWSPPTPSSPTPARKP